MDGFTKLVDEGGRNELKAIKLFGRMYRQSTSNTEFVISSAGTSESPPSAQPT
jgi:hypothetical protein